MDESLDLQNNPGNVERWLDRLVDGELSIDQERQLLRALESQPQMWRQCALAFIEARAWRSEMSGIVAKQLDNSEVVKAAAGTTVFRRTSRTFVPRWLTIAATLILAFTFGVASQHLIPRGQEKATAPSVTPTSMAFTDANSPIGDPKSNREVSSEIEHSPVKDQTVQVSLLSDDGQEQSVVVPLEEGSEEKLKSMLAEQHPMLSPAVRKALESAGHEIEERRAFYPVKLDDGRQAVVPMNIVELRNTGGWQ
jgi:hypothetical protein